MLSLTRPVVVLALAAGLSVAHAADLRTEVPEGAVSARLRIALPGGDVVERAYTRAAEAGAVDPLAIVGATAAEGTYRYEIVFAQALPEAVAREAAEARSMGGDGAPQDAPSAFPSVSGSFLVSGGRIVLPGTTEPGAVGVASSGPGTADQVIADDLIVQGSGCFGLDCVNNEVFGFATVRLKENNTRIEFRDTSASAGFAATSWQLTANESPSGGANQFMIEDLTAATVPFKVSGAAPTDAFFVSPTGRIGLRTATPVLDLHITTSNTPAHRLEQTNAGGFTAQTWDIAGNEANFFVRDVTAGSRLPFRIRPGAPTSSLDIAASGNVGIGTASPQARLHVVGDAYVAGTLTQLSSRTSKTHFAAVAADELLDRLAELPIWTWNYLQSDAHDRHIGPVAEDFYRAFGFGTSERQLAPSDVAGVALAATQALQRELAARDRTIETLEARLARLEALLGERAGASRDVP